MTHLCQSGFTEDALLYPIDLQGQALTGLPIDDR